MQHNTTLELTSRGYEIRCPCGHHDILPQSTQIGDTKTGLRQPVQRHLTQRHATA